MMLCKLKWRGGHHCDDQAQEQEGEEEMKGGNKMKETKKKIRD